VQLGFQKNTGFHNFIFVVRSTADCFNGKGSSVYAAGRDISKQYDTMLHNDLFEAIVNTCMPSRIVYLLMELYGKPFLKVR
jgi:hypothetical protein